jgi:gamma-glutamylaminecyclotransferase
MNHHVFVYGTLLRGEPNHRMMRGARFVRPARTAPSFTLVDLGYFPALRAEGVTRVVGEVYEVSPALLEALDRFEGVPRLYQRVGIQLEDGGAAYVYVQPADARGGPAIRSGEWRGYRKEQGYAGEIAE